MHNKNILLCGGGTGGHYYPLMAIKKDLESKSDFKFSYVCLLYTSPSPRDQRGSRMPSSA